MFITLEVSDKAITDLQDRARANCYSLAQAITKQVRFPVLAVKVTDTEVSTKRRRYARRTG